MARKILLADDSVTAQNMGRKILADAGYDVITVNNGSAALKKIAEHKPDLIVLDVYMPGYSGLEVCQRLKESQETSRMPVLLTVGKLEPFKPEESKRVRADGFIVKPFEASELLSALSKLEDKIVPRGESSKPGRFARATAAIEDGRFDKSVAVDEDSGWRNRIAFPSKKKDKAVQEDGDDPAIYNAINKDLRTVVEHKVADQPPAAKAEEVRVDLGALAPEGLPKDVTPEEIAALAAAAAQVKGKIAEGREPAPLENQSEAKSELKSEPKSEPKIEAKETVQPAVEPGATFAEQTSEEKSETINEARAEKAVEAHAEEARIPAPASANSTVAADLEPVTSAGDGSWSHSPAGHTADEPITMAAAAGVGTVAAVSRWTAVSVALAPDDAGVSLEQEMQKAHAAFAPPSASGVATSELAAVSAEMSTATEALPNPEPPAAEPAIPELADAAPEAAQTLIDVANASPEAITAAVKELEAVAASYEAQNAAPAATVPSVENIAVAAPESSIAEVAAAVDHTEPAGLNPETPDATSTSIHEAPSELTSGNSVAEAPVTESANTPLAEDPAHEESEAAQTTAAAWANWRRNRESGEKVGSESPAATEANSNTQDSAAMAVAAGAEKHPEDASPSESNPEDIANIVDSVLADLRPKIFEEISRKMGKKK